jgi:DNA-binding transcriptional regulator YiaG
MEQRRKEKQLSSSQKKSSPVIRAIKELGTYGLRIPYIAERLNIPEATIAQWSSGGQEPSNSKETLHQLKRLLQMTKRLS